MTADQQGGAGRGSESAASTWRRRVLVWVAVTAVVGIAMAVGMPDREGEDLVAVGRGGRSAPAFSLPSLADENVTIALADFSGMPVVVNFWASWCVPCRREMPALEALHQEFAGRVAFVGVNHQDQRDEALALLAETGISYPSVHDPKGDVALDYELFGMPTTVFVTADGRIAGRHTGELTEADLRDALEALILTT